MTIQQERRKAGLAGILLLVTTLAVLLQAIGLNKKLVIDPSTDIQFNALDDRPVGGDSVASIELDGDEILLNCEIIKKGYQWPFCSISFKLAEGNNGIDLSNYSHFKLWIRYKNPQDTGIRFQARHFDPDYSRYEDESSLKYNTIEFYEKTSSYPLVVPLQQFQVPTWWLVWKGLSHEDGVTDFSNVYSLDVVTGYSVDPGDRSMVIERIEIVGELISGQDLYLILLLIWGTLGLFYFIDTMFFAQKPQKSSAQQEQELEALSDLLEQKSEELEHSLSRNPVTGALNPESILDLFKSSARHSTAANLSLMFVDIDNFNKLTEAFSEEFGNEVLAKVSHVLFKNIRNSDIIARWGAKQFVLVCSHTELTFAKQLAEKLRKLIEEIDWEHDVQVTVSIGVAEKESEEPPTAFISRATKALKSAKAQGRNKVVSATPHMVEITQE